MYNHRIPKEKSPIVFILKSLIPYTEANLMLAFKPSLFFSELSKISGYKRRALESAMRKAEQNKLIEMKVEEDRNLIKITDKGQQLIRPFVAQKLKRNSKLMIIFDVPEEMYVARNRLRRVLRSWNFQQIQKSVWVTNYDHRQSVKELVSELKIEPYVGLFECATV